MITWHCALGPLLFAHRGACAEAPENSLPAFERAWQCGADVFETDLHQTRDGDFVLSHDRTGLRMAGVDRAIGASSLDEVKTWDLGLGFVDALGQRPFRGRGVHPLTLQEALDAFPDVLFNVDVKQASVSALPRLIDLVAARGAADRVLLTSFSGHTLRRIRSLGYPGPTGMSRPDVARLALVPASIYRWVSVRSARVQIAPRHFFKNFATRKFIDKCHNFGLAVDFWVINQPERAAALLALGADGIMTDDPARIAPAFRDYPGAAPWRQRHGQHPPLSAETVRINRD